MFFLLPAVYEVLTDTGCVLRFTNLSKKNVLFLPCALVKIEHETFTLCNFYVLPALLYPMKSSVMQRAEKRLPKS